MGAFVKDGHSLMYLSQSLIASLQAKITASRLAESVETIAQLGPSLSDCGTDDQIRYLVRKNNLDALAAMKG